MKPNKGKKKTKVKKVKVQPKVQKKKFTQVELQFPENITFTNH